MEKQSIEQAFDKVNTKSNPSDLKITDMRIAVVCSNYDYPIIRLDTNQGVYGIGEVRDAGHKENALQFKSMLLGQNPCNVDMLYRAISRFGNWGREGGGVSGIELALWDLVGKVYGVPCYQFLGGKYRDQVRVYADTPTPADPTPDAYVQRVLGRKDLGLTFIKFDIGPAVFHYYDGSLIGSPPKGEYRPGNWGKAPGAHYGSQVTDAGIERMAEIVAAVRGAVGWETSLCIDHFGHGTMTIKEVIRLANALEPYGLAWMEDPVPWADIEGHRIVTRAINVPTAAGEELYLLDGFREMIENARRGYPAPRPVDLGRHARDQAHRRSWRALRAAHRPALRGFAHCLHGKFAYRRRHFQFRGARAPRLRPAFLEQPGDRPARAADGRWLREGAREARPGRGPEPGRHPRKPAPAQRSLRPDR